MTFEFSLRINPAMKKPGWNCATVCLTLFLLLFLLQGQRASAAFMVGIAGATASGKSTLAKRLEAALRPKFKVCKLSQDSYYLPLAEQPASILIQEPLALKGTPNWDHPGAFDFKKMTQDLQALKDGKPVQVPVYDFKVNDRTGFVELGPCEIVVFEGIFVLHDAEISSQLDLKYFVELEAPKRMARRLKRDVKSRGKTEEFVKLWFNAVAEPMYLQYGEPTKQLADVFVVSGESTDHDVSKIAFTIEARSATPDQDQ